MPTLKQVQEELKKFLSTLLHNIFATIAVSIVGIPVLISWATGTIDILFETIKLPTPLWATIVLVLLMVVYVYIKTGKRCPSVTPKTRRFITKYFTVGKYKWETKIYDSGYFEVDKYPFCTTHDLKFIYSSNGKYCPGTDKQSCNNILRTHDEFKVYESAKSNIENKVRNKQY